LKLLAEIESYTHHVLATEIVKKINLMNAVLLMKEAWHKVTCATIQNGFKKANFANDFSKPIKINDILLSSLGKLNFDFNQYLEIDNKE